MSMSWCRFCGRYHLYGACTVTVETEEQAWRQLRKLLRQLTRHGVS